MPIVTIGPLGSQNINQSETDSVNLVGVGTLNIAGTPQNPIDVTLSQLTNAAGLATINLSYAHVHLSSIAGVSLGATFNIGNGGILDFQNYAGAAVATSVNFTGATGQFILGTGYTPTLLSGFTGFGPGKTIDIISSVVQRLVYSDNNGVGTGGTLTLYGPNNTQLAAIPFGNGEFTSSNFGLTPDGGGGTLIQFNSIVTGLSVTPNTAILGTGATATFAATMSNPVSITGGPPALTLNNGGSAVYDPVNSTGTRLLFTYTVAPGQDVADLAATGILANGATLATVGGGGITLAGFAGNPTGTLTVDTVAPSVTSITIDQPNATLAAGGNVTLRVAVTEAITFSGTPTLSLNDGGIANYDAASSTPTSLVFRHTVQPGQNSADLAVTGIGGNVTDRAGNPVAFPGTPINPPGTLVVDTLAPTITGITVDRPNSILAAGQTIVFTATLSEPVVVSGSPILMLNDGGTATYDAASSSPTTLVYRHTVQPGQNSANLAITSVNLNGSIITDPAGNALTFPTMPPNPSGTVVVDTLAPTVTGVIVDRPNATLAVGQMIAFTVTLSEGIAIAGGTPTLALSDGGVATYDPSLSAPTSLVFHHTVQPGQNSADLAITGVSLNGALATDPAGNALDLTGIIGNPAGVLVVDTTIPTITGITVDRPNATLAAGQTVAFTVALSEPVTLSGNTPTLALSDGGTATFDPTSSTPTSLVFRHTVQPGQNSADLAVTALNFGGIDGAGNALSLAGAPLNPAGTLVIDTLTPTVTGVTVDRPNAAVSAGQTVAFTIALSEGIAVAGGTPTLALSDGGIATYDANLSTPTNLVFRHTIQPGQNSTDLSINGIALNGAIATDGAGNPLDLAGIVGNPAGILLVDTIAPTVTAIAVDRPTNNLVPGDTVTISITLSEAIAVAGTNPTLALSDGGTATYDPAYSTPTTLAFRHTVQPGQNTANLAITGLSLTGATLTDPAGNGLDTTGVVGNPPVPLTVDAIAPTVTTVIVDRPNANLAAGQVITITVDLSEAVVLTGGSPTLSLSDGGVATYDASASTMTSLAFRHTVQPGQNSPDLTITGATLNGATLADLAGNAADLAGIVTNPAGTLVIDTSTPTVTSLTLDQPNANLAAGQTVTVTITLSEAIALSGNAPTLSLSDGGTATYDANASTPTSLVFRHTIQPGQNSPDLAITAVTLDGADLAGNVLDATGIVGNPAGTLVVDTAAPTVTTVTLDPPDGSLAAGRVVTVTVTLSEAVAVAGGTPTLSLSDGGTATYDPNGSTPTTLLFRHTIQPGQNATDLAILGVALNGAILADPSGNAIDPNGLVGNPAGTLRVDTQSPTMTGVVTNPSTGQLGSGDTVDFTISVSEAVTLVGQTPSLTLSDGGTATYDATRSTPTSLVFSHAIQPGQGSADLSITSATLAGLVDGAGNTLNFNSAFSNPAGILTVDTTPAPAPVTSAPTPGSLVVYRFFNSASGTHFYTSSEAERANVLQTRPDLIPEGGDGIGFRAVNPAGDMTGAVEVFRFFDTVNGTQFLTASTVERDGIIATRPDLRFEPTGSFFEHAVPQEGDNAIYRFFSSTNGTHFYTNSPTERAAIIQSRPDLIDEGIGFYEPK